MDILFYAAVSLVGAVMVLLAERALHRHEQRKANAEKLRERLVIRRVRRAF